ncbi:MAG TPA: NAD(P)(+) transhydrogenase (Re/Si-specific) subunit beta [Halioglobus sp.]
MDTVALYLYVLSAVLFILSLKWMSNVRMSRWGNLAGVCGMAVAIGTTLLAYQIQRYDLLLGALLVGTLIGAPIALKLPMTAVPQRTAMSHAFGSFAVALIGMAEYYQRLPNAAEALGPFTTAVLAVEIVLGFLTFMGSVIAFMKLQELISGRPLVYPGRNFVSVGVFLISVGLAIALVFNPTNSALIPIITVFALIFGFLLVMGIGGADMPTVIAILNAYAGLSAAALGFVLNNKLLIVAGTLDGSSGLILAFIMCKSMNRSFLNVLFGGVGSVVSAASGSAKSGEERTVHAFLPEDLSIVLGTAQTVVIAPGYGMAVAQAQHVVKELEEALVERGTEVRYAIHPVAGRMPGHMNVLLAEADVSYDKLIELEEINPLLAETDVAIVLGANDVVNPAARNAKDSPIYGMPILEVDRARTVVVIKRSMASGFAGVYNDLFYNPKTMMVFGDAKKVLAEVVKKMTAT